MNPRIPVSIPEMRWSSRMRMGLCEVRVHEVVVEEVIPETQQDKYTDIATLGFIGGFIVMMTLDVALG